LDAQNIPLGPFESASELIGLSNAEPDQHSINRPSRVTALFLFRQSVKEIF